MPRTASLLLSLALLAAACSSDTTETTVAPTTATTLAATTTVPDEITFVGADGVESIITDTSRIVSLNGDITEILFELQVDSQVVGIDFTTTYPTEAAALPIVGLAQQGQLAAEPVLELAPTLVIGDQRTSPAEVVQQIRDAGVPVVIIQLETDLSGIRRKIETVAMIVGEEAAGAELANLVDGEIEAALALIADVDLAETPQVAFVYSQPGALLLFGPGSPSSALINAAGAADPVRGPPAGPLTPEALAAANPDVIITTEGALGALGGIEAFLALPGVAQTPAGAASRILAYDEAIFLGLSPRAGQALSQLILDLHPELTGG